MAFGPRMGISLVQKATITQQQRLVMRAMQAARAQILESSDEGIEARLARLIEHNPALRWRNPAAARGGAVARQFARPAEDDRGPMEARWTASPELMEHLASQFVLERTTPSQRTAGLMIIGNLDHRGLLAATAEEIVEATPNDLPITEEDVEAAQKVVMELEPEGCGARDLLHYLTWTVGRLYEEDPFFPDLIANHLDELRDRKFKRIAKAMEMEEEDVEEYASMLGNVAPWPARGYGADPMEHVVPTLEVTRNPETHALQVVVAEPPRSRVVIDQRFEERIKEMEEGTAKKEARAQLDEARAVVRQVEERQSLVGQIAKIAVREQRNYFERGDAALKNLTMNRVADQLQVDPSSVSRAVKGRYYQWGGQVEELRKLFSHRSKPGKVSEQKLHALIREVVADENPRKPLTDTEIMEELRRRGVREARRTVAKHRAKAGVPSSRDRRQRDEED